MKGIAVSSLIAAICAPALPQSLFSQSRPPRHTSINHLLIPNRVYHTLASPVSGNALVDNLSVTPFTLAANVSDNDLRYEVRVFDRKTRKERWRKQTTQMPEQPAVGTLSVRWNLLGVVGRTSVEDVVVVDCFQMKNVAKRNGERLTKGAPSAWSHSGGSA